MTVTFLGAARTVTGSKHLVTLENGKKILLDCGFFQGHGTDTDAMNRSFAIDPSTVHALVLSHAHIDHSGNIPNFVKQGFDGPIYCTPPTFDLCRIMLADTAHIQENDAAFLNKRRVKKGLPRLKPIYGPDDVQQALALFKPLPLNTPKEITPGVTLEFTEAGHILGAAAVHLVVKEGQHTTRLAFTGDIGRPVDSILRSPAPFPQADDILCESTYGNRTHDSSEATEARLLEVVYHTCIKKRGKLVVPAFSLGRTQELVYVLNNLSNQKKVPAIPVYVYSPLSVNATGIMRAHVNSLNDGVRNSLLNDPDPFAFNGLHYIQDVNVSKALNSNPEPCIIISASGMAEAGRIKHHIKNTIGDSRNGVLIVGYCTPESLGGRLVAGQKSVRIFGEEYDVRARVEVFESFSAHADAGEMLGYLACQDPGKVKTLFLVHGDYDVQQDWQATLENAGFRDVKIPEQGDSIVLSGSRS